MLGTSIPGGDVTRRTTHGGSDGLSHILMRTNCCDIRRMRRSFTREGRPLVYIHRHQEGDWGELSEEDRRENEIALRQGFRILSAYTLTTGVKVWVITEADRSSTTMILPEDY